MRLVVEADTFPDAVLAMTALQLALKPGEGGPETAWRKKPGEHCGVKLVDRYFTVTTTKSGWSVRENKNANT